MTSQANGMQRKVGVAIFISEEIDFKIKRVTRDKNGHFLMIKGTIQCYVDMLLSRHNNYQYIYSQSGSATHKASINRTSMPS